MPKTEFLSPGVFGLEVAPTRAREGISPAKMGIIGWTERGPVNTPIEVRSVNEFTQFFGGLNSRGLVAISMRAFFGNGGQRAWVVRVVPSDATTASVDVDSPAKWTFNANGAGSWGNSLVVRIEGNRNFLDRTPGSEGWSKFDLKVLQPTQFDPSILGAAETFEAIQFVDPLAADYVVAAMSDPRSPSLLLEVVTGAGGTPAGLLATTVTDEVIGSGDASGTKDFVGTLANADVLDGTLRIVAADAVVNDEAQTTTPAVDNVATGFTFTLPNAPLLDGSLRLFFAKAGPLRNVAPAVTGAINGTNTDFTIAAGALSPVHKETAVFQIKLPNTDAASGVVGNHGTTTGAGDFDLAANPVPVTTAGQPVHPGTVSVVFSPSGNIVDNGDGTVTGSGFPGPTTSLTGFIDYDTGKMYTDAAFTTPLVVTGAANGTAASSAVTTTFDVSTFIEKAATTDNLAQGVALAAAALNGASLDAGGTNPNTIDLVDSVTAPTGSGAISFSTTAPSAPSTYGPGVILVDYVAAGVVDSDVAGNLSGDVGVGTNTVDFTTGDVDVELASPALGVTLSHGAVTSGPFSVGETVTGGTSGATGTVAVLGSGFMVVESVANGPFQSGEVVTGGTSGASATLDSASLLTGSSIDADYQTGQVVTDDGLGNLIGDVDAAGNNTIDYATGAYDVTFAAAPLNGSNVLANYVSLPRVVEFQLTGGSDGTAVTRAEISDPSLEANKEGIYAFDDVEDPLNMVVPDFEGSQFVQADLVDFAKARNTRFAILGAANGTTKDEVIKYVLVDQAFDNKVSAFYWPNVYFVNELTNRPELIPVTPFVAGVYARTAFNKNVGKSPGGIEDGRIDANGVVGPEFGNLINDINVRDALYQSRINPLFNSDATGFVVWGVRSLSTETRWRYVNARLLHNFLMDAVNRQLQWAVFENNGPALWARIETALKGFFGSLFRQGYFAGTTEEQAFFVVCNRSNNNQSTIDEGKVIVDIGFSPFKPAEFIVFRLSQPASTITI